MGRLSNLHFYDDDQQVHEGDYGSYNDFVNWDYDEQEQEQEEEVRKFKRKIDAYMRKISKIKIKYLSSSCMNYSLQPWNMKQ